LHVGDSSAAKIVQTGSQDVIDVLHLSFVKSPGMSVNYCWIGV